MRGCGCSATPALADLIPDPDAVRLVRLSVSAVGAYVDARQALGRARRAELLLGKGAGRRDQQFAQLAGETSLGQFRQLQQALHRVIDGLDQPRREGLDASLAGQALRQSVAGVRTRAALTLVDSAASPAASRAAMEQLDEGLDRIGGLTTVDQVLAYLDERVNRLVDEREPLRAADDGQSGLCVLILLLSSVLVVLALIAVLACLFGLVCDPNAVLQEMIDNACAGR